MTSGAMDTISAILKAIDWTTVGILISVGAIDTAYGIIAYGKTDSVALDITGFSLITVLFTLTSRANNNAQDLPSVVLKFLGVLGLALVGLAFHSYLRKQTTKEIKKYFRELRAIVQDEQKRRLLETIQELTEEVLEVDVGYRFLGLGSGNPSKENKRALILDTLRNIGIDEKYIDDPSCLLIKGGRTFYMFVYIVIGLASIILASLWGPLSH